MFQFSRQTLYKGSQIGIFCIQNILKLVTMVQGLLGPLMHCLMPRKSFLCNFGIDFAFYNLARCLAWPGSRLNIFGLKTGSLGWRKDTNRIYIFTTRQSGVGEEESWSDIYNYPAGHSIHSSQTFLHHLFSGFSSASRSAQVNIASSKNFSAFPAFAAPAPRAPRRAPIMHAADRFKQQVGSQP